MSLPIALLTGSLSGPSTNGVAGESSPGLVARGVRSHPSRRRPRTAGTATGTASARYTRTGAECSQWAVGQPAATNPLLDITGAS